jgi:hypothetical protein
MVTEMVRCGASVVGSISSNFPFALCLGIHLPNSLYIARWKYSIPLRLRVRVTFRILPERTILKCISNSRWTPAVLSYQVLATVIL